MEINKKHFVSVWLHKYDWRDGVESVRKNQDLIDEVSPAWYELRAESQIQAIKDVTVDDMSLREVAPRLMPLVMSVDAVRTRPEFVRPLFLSVFERKTHADKLARLCVEHNYSGLHIDYEGLQASEMVSFSEVVVDIGKALHAKNKKLSVSIEAQADSLAFIGWSIIAEVADSVFFLTYGGKPKKPGPLSNFSRIETYLRQAIEVFPKQKLVHAVAIYGLRWTPRGIESGVWRDYTPKDKRIRLIRDPETKALSYESDGNVTWYEDATSIMEKVNLGASIGISRFAFWRLGGEDPELWNKLRKMTP